MPRLVAYIVVFVSSCCTLILELVAGRILAPFIGVSLYTWTSIIGVVLAGISLGNYLGGRIADRWPQRRTLGRPDRPQQSARRRAAAGPRHAADPAHRRHHPTDLLSAQLHPGHGLT